jgi:transposase
VLADALRTDAGRWALVQPDSEETVALRMLVRARHDLIDHRIAVHNQLLAVLQHNFPGAIGLFSQLDIPISLAFLERFPGEARAVWLSEQRLAHWLKARGYCGRQTAAELIDHLGEAATGRVTGAAVEASELIVRALVELLTQLCKQQATLEGRIKKALLAHPDGPIFRSLPRAGIVRAATLLAEIGDCRARYPDPAALAAAAGVAPSTRQSGKHLNVAYRRGCNKQLRAALVDWAQDTPRANAWAADTSRRARDRGCRHPHAARILAQAWTRILWRCWHDHQPSTPTNTAGSSPSYRRALDLGLSAEAGRAESHHRPPPTATRQPPSLPTSSVHPEAAEYGSFRVVELSNGVSLDLVGGRLAADQGSLAHMLGRPLPPARRPHQPQRRRPWPVLRRPDGHNLEIIIAPHRD